MQSAIDELQTLWGGLLNGQLRSHAVLLDAKRNIDIHKGVNNTKEGIQEVKDVVNKILSGISDRL